MTKELIRDMVRSALGRLFSSEDLWLLQDDANERSISFRLAGHLEKELKGRGEAWSGLHVDCEYNRDVSNLTPPYSKKLNLPQRNDVSNEDTHATTVFPDIIVHCRRSDTNRVVIEIKKAGGHPAQSFSTDR